MKKILKDEKGMVVVEAAFVFPIIIIITILLYFTALYMFQIYYLQAASHSAATYASAILSDNQNTSLDSAYGYASYDTGKMINPYATLFSPNMSDFNTRIIEEINTYPILKNVIPDAEIKTEVVNYVVYKEIIVSISGVMELPKPLHIFGIKEIEINSSAKKFVDNTDEFIRNTDIAFNLVHLFEEEFSIPDFFSKAKEMHAKIGNK